MMAERTSWPWPEDTREDRAKRIALSYRELLSRIARGEQDDTGQLLDAAGERAAARAGVDTSGHRALLTHCPLT